MNYYEEIKNKIIDNETKRNNQKQRIRKITR